MRLLFSPLLWTAAILASFLYSVDLQDSIGEDRENSWRALGEIARVDDAERRFNILQADFAVSQSELRRLASSNPTIGFDALRERLDAMRRQVFSGRESAEEEMQFADQTLSAVEARIESKRRRLEIAEWVRLILTLGFGVAVAHYAAYRRLPAL